MYDLDKAKQLCELLKQSGYNCAMAKFEGEDDHLMVILEDFKEEFPSAYFKYQFDQDEYYVHLEKLIQIDIDNDNEYYEALQLVNYQNSGNGLFRWYINAEGYIEALYVPCELFDKDVEFYGGLFDMLMDEIYEFVEQ